LYVIPIKFVVIIGIKLSCGVSNCMLTVYPSLQDTIPHAVNHSLALLKMGKLLPETC